MVCRAQGSAGVLAPLLHREKCRGATRQGGCSARASRRFRRSTVRDTAAAAGCAWDLVYNPVGATLPPPQAGLQDDYKVRLKADFGIDFDNLLTIANLPINRFEHFLARTGQLDRYRQLLVDNFNPATVRPLMCRHLLSVDWQGYLYDCDFNQMLKLPMAASGRKQLWQITRAQLENAPIALGKHCFGCTAGAGSSCGGALT